MTLTGIPSTDRIHCFSGKEGRVNSVIVRGQRGTVVVDTQVTLDDGEELRRVADSMSGARPILYVLITHEHFDHIAGNQFFTCDIISSRKARDEILRMGRTAAGFILTPPTLAFEILCEISMGDLTLVMRHHGGHCPGESSVFIPETGTLIAGDLVFQGRDPFVGSADVVEWVNALSELYMLMPEVVIPGHGSPSGRELLIEQRTYLEKFYEEIVRAKSESIPPDEAWLRYCEARCIPSQRRDGFLAAVKKIYATGA